MCYAIFTHYASRPLGFAASIALICLLYLPWWPHEGVQDLGPDDVVVFKCGACGHTAELPPSMLLRGLGLEPTAKILDLERRLRCRLCLARGQAVVSIQWKATS